MTIDQDHAYADRQYRFQHHPLIDLTALLATPVGTPLRFRSLWMRNLCDCRRSNRGVAVVTALQQVQLGSVSGVLDVVTLNGAPAKSSSSSLNTISSAPTGIVYDPREPGCVLCDFTS